MKSNRRDFIKIAAAGATLLAGNNVRALGTSGPSAEELDKAAARPVLRCELFRSPVLIASVELLRNDREFLVRVRSEDGAEGLAVSNSAKMRSLYPLFLQQIAPFFVGKDARDLDALIEGVFIWKSNYKLQGQSFWVCVASVEFAILDLLGKIAGKPVGETLGNVYQRKVAIYRASGNRGNKPEEEIAVLEKMVGDTGTNAIKFKVGGRMQRNRDSLPGRSEALIPMVRKTFGEDMTVYADSNGSYDVENSIRIGRLMQENRFAFFEEPCPFDQLNETKQVADTLTIPIAGGEQESSHHRFRWMILDDGLQIVQPDLFYFGGFIRTIRVARMAQVAGIPCTPHMSGTSLGFMYVLHYASIMKNCGPHQEYKGGPRVPLSEPTSSLLSEGGTVSVPTGPGWGVTVDPGFVNKAVLVY